MENTWLTFQFILNYTIAPIIFLFGFFGNIIGLIVISRKELNKIGPVLIYKFLFISDNIYLSKYL